IVIVDTGSTDRTKAEARRFTDRVFDFEWCDDAAKARNFGLAECRIDYVMWLDADDVIDESDARRLRQIVAGPKDWDVLMLPYHYRRDEHGRTTVLQVRERIFDRRMGFSFEYPAHECVKIPPGARVGRAMYVKIVHNNLFRHEPSNVRHLRILSKAVETDDYRNSFRMWWLLAREERPEKSVLIFRKVLADFASRPGFSQPLHAKIWYELGQRLFSLNRLDEALEAFGRSISLYPLWREPFFAGGKTLFAQRRQREALSMFKLAGRISPPDVSDVVSYDPSIYDGEQYFEWLFTAYHAVGDLENARQALAQGIRAIPQSAVFQQRCVEFGVPFLSDRF
ncbi:MAG: tetratricopeptide repeat-containing glycosyltransferase, partial [Pirellulales bacterium]